MLHAHIKSTSDVRAEAESTATNLVRFCAVHTSGVHIPDQPGQVGGDLGEPARPLVLEESGRLVPQHRPG